MHMIYCFAYLVYSFAFIHSASTLSRSSASQIPTKTTMKSFAPFLAPCLTATAIPLPELVERDDQNTCIINWEMSEDYAPRKVPFP
jgi:hypothetical protein